MSLAESVFSFDTALYVFFALQVGLCFTVIPNVTWKSVEIGGLLISPTAQYTYGTFLCLVVVATMFATMGLYYDIRFNVAIYLLVVVAAFFFNLAWLIAFGIVWHSLPVIVAAFILVVFEGVGIALVWEATDVVWERYQESILPYIMYKHAVVEKRGGVGQSVDEEQQKPTAFAASGQRFSPNYGNIITSRSAPVDTSI
uniref:Uncharacterized protein n=1 Tax=Noctiluca scintillans TaxID=2966 RepID=A0A7S0ZQY3_NOCSC|mmetsp:Transcript_1485/g.4057  ORF Transcript_1485/g.4057 Transcript_1485/m.4057 type:complete len:199 (+) Transcript_1485:64-660(+)